MSDFFCDICLGFFKLLRLKLKFFEPVSLQLFFKLFYPLISLKDVPVKETYLFGEVPDGGFKLERFYALCYPYGTGLSGAFLPARGDFHGNGGLLLPDILFSAGLRAQSLWT